MKKSVFRIGILGSDSSHAEVFSKLINNPLPENGGLLFKDCKVTAIYGHDEQRTKEVAQRSQIEFIAEKAEELLDKVDAIMVVFRDGNLHAQYALPFIKIGIPTWIDKPFTVKDEDAEEIVMAAKRYNTLVTGGSTCKYAEKILRAKDIVKSNNLGRIEAASISFNAGFNDPYGGIYFYGAHLVEMALEVFGYNPKAVSSSISSDGMISVLKYEDYEVSLNFIEKLDKGTLNIYGEKQNITYEIDISKVYMEGLQRFVEMLRTRKAPFKLDNMLKVVRVFNAIVKSLEVKSEIIIRAVE
ncbi:Gfo/Idh/MocA family oxidoreductase [Clostridium swellfunianum]|uniref:Gfo/Idh/MocA family protein n=1 Tax=Clostridium swellfunianum TaxID=1367462 RepID=UPI00202FD033|nr:Gfo/Idh/MocA family oxidoreductase [Clostridium swellfunianum]MCM0647569.1 Gfo/Idh/MocA family oxidoreductase [Clostridium swellfunianum]